MNEKQRNNNYFTVVETVEAGRPVLFTVPHQWVQGNILSWPPKKADVIRKDAASEPLSTWSKMKCLVMRKYIPSFEEAELEVAELSGVTTDAETLDVVRKVKRKKNLKIVPTKRTPSSSKLNFNHHFSVEDNLTGPISSQPQPTVTALAENPASLQHIASVIEMAPMMPEEMSSKPPEQSSLYSQAVMFSEQSSGQQLGSGAQSAPPEYIFSVEQQPLDHGRATNEIIQRIDRMEEGIKQHVSTCMETLLVKTIAAVRSDFDAKMELLLESKQVSDHQCSFKLDPVSTEEELFELEQNLLDKDYARQVMNYMKQIIGDTGDTVNGQNVCYVLVDKFFNRQFMTSCSWTGLSRSGDRKIGLKECKNILNVFFTIVNSVNEHFSVKTMEDFLKSVTRNAKKRSELKNIRQSTIKRRGTKQHNSPIVILQVGNEQVIPLESSTMLAGNAVTDEASSEAMAGMMGNTLNEFNWQEQVQQEMSSEYSGEENENEEEV